MWTRYQTHGTQRVRTSDTMITGTVNIGWVFGEYLQQRKNHPAADRIYANEHHAALGMHACNFD